MGFKQVTKIKVDGKNAQPDKSFSKNMSDSDIIVYAHEFQSIRTWFMRKSDIQVTVPWYARDNKKIYCVAGRYRKGRWMATEVYDALDLRHQGWGVGSIGGLLGGWTGNPISDKGIDSVLERALYTKRCFVALTMDDLIPPNRQKFIYGQEFPTELFLESGPSVTFGDVQKALCGLKGFV